jgi:hypothetical protein
MVRRTVALVALIGSAALLPFPAREARADEAADTATARALGIEGFKLAEAGRCSEAIDKLARAEKLRHAPTTATRLAECEIETGKIVRGTERLQRLIREPLPPNAHPVFLAAMERAQTVLAAALPRLATLRISVRAPRGAKLELFIDGEPVSDAVLDTDRRIDPGTHTVLVRAPGFLPATTTTPIAEGGTASVTLELQLDPRAPAEEPRTEAAPIATSTPPAVEPTSDSKAPAIIALVLGAAGVSLGTYGATQAAKGAAVLSDRCDENGVCPSDMKPTLREAKTWATVSTAGFIAGGAGIVTGTVLLVVSGGSSSNGAKAGVRVRPSVGAMSLGIDGVF